MGRRHSPQEGGGDPAAEIPAPDNLRADVFKDGGEEFVLLEWPARPLPVPGGLTRAETEVVRLLLEGLGNHEIAAARGTSVRTVANQVASAYRSLGVASCHELRARVASLSKPEGKGTA